MRRRTCPTCDGRGTLVASWLAVGAARAFNATVMRALDRLDDLARELGR